MKKFTVLLMLALALVLLPAPTAQAAEPHPYATALQEFFQDARGDKAAILVDLNGDGVEEMVAVKSVDADPPEKTAFNDIDDVIGFFSIEDGNIVASFYVANGPAPTENSFINGNIYISTANYLILDGFGQTAPGDFFTVLEYQNGVITAVALTERMSDEDADYDFDYLLDGEIITKDQFEAYTQQYGFQSVEKLLCPKDSYEYPTLFADDSAQILAMTESDTAPAPASKTVNPTASTVYVNGAATAFEAYNIDGNNFFKLRDLAAVLNGTGKQFEVGYDNDTKAITLTSGEPYTTVGGELVAGDGKEKTATPTASIIYLDGVELNLTVYTINGNNFFKLRDLMQAIDVYVGYDNATKAITLDTGKGYVAE